MNGNNKFESFEREEPHCIQFHIHKAHIFINFSWLKELVVRGLWPTLTIESIYLTFIRKTGFYLTAL